MKIHFFGSAASEGVPAMFCECEYCKEARSLGGKNLRTRTATRIDDDLLIDFSSDIYAQTLFRGLDLTAINHLLITHSHGDHFYPTDLMQIRPPKAFYTRERTLEIYGSTAVTDKVQEVLEHAGEDAAPYLHLNEASSFAPFKAGAYRVTPLPASHDKREECFLYLLEKDGKTLLYAHDSGTFSEKVWEALAAVRLSCVVLDCTSVTESHVFEGHMGLGDNVAIKERMLREGIAAAKTVFIATHFVHSHQPIHERITPIFAEQGIVASYDGLEMEF